MQGQNEEHQSWRGLRMASPSEPVAFEAERAMLFLTGLFIWYVMGVLL